MLIFVFISFVTTRDTEVKCDVSRIQVKPAAYDYLRGYKASMGNCHAKNGTISILRETDLTFDCGFHEIKTRQIIGNLTMIRYQGEVVYEKPKSKWLMKSADFNRTTFVQKVTCSYYKNLTVSTNELRCINNCERQQVIIEPLSNQAVFNITKGIYADEHMLVPYTENSEIDTETDRIFVGLTLHIVERQEYVIVLHELWITPGPNPTDPRGVYLVDRDASGCVKYHWSVKGASTVSEVFNCSNNASPHISMEVKADVIYEAGIDGEMYVHYATRICVIGAEDCTDRRCHDDGDRVMQMDCFANNCNFAEIPIDPVETPHKNGF